MWAFVDEVRTLLRRQDQDFLVRLHKIQTAMEEFDRMEKENGRPLKLTPPDNDVRKAA